MGQKTIGAEQLLNKHLMKNKNVRKFIYDWVIKEWYKTDMAYCNKGKMKLWTKAKI